MKLASLLLSVVLAFTVLAALAPSAFAVDYVFTPIDFPGAQGTFPFGINNHGQIAGSYCIGRPGCGLLSDGRTHGFVWSDGIFRTVDITSPENVEQTEVHGINNHGELALTFYTADCSASGCNLNSHGFGLPSRSPFQQVRVLGINDSGHLVGHGGNTGWLWDGTSFQLFGPPGGFLFNDPMGINNNGEIVGTAIVFAQPAGFRGFLISGGQASFIDVPPSLVGFHTGFPDDCCVTRAHGINNKGEIVGVFPSAGEGVRGFILSGGQFTKIHVPFPGALHTYLFGINDSGQLVGIYETLVGALVGVPHTGTVIKHGFLATPVPADALAPVTTAATSPQPNANGWNNTNVTVTLNATDDPGGSGVKEIQFSLSGAQGGAGVVSANVFSVTISAEGITTLTYFARDNAGNQETPAKQLTVKIDKTPPMVTFGAPSPAPNAAGWNNTDVSIAFAVTDNLSGVASTSSASPLVLTAEGMAVTAAVSATDVAGNTATSTSPAVKIDKTPPTVACNVSPNALWPPNHKLLAVSASVTVTDTLSGSGGFTLTSVTSSEPDGGLGDGDVPNDIQGFTPGTADLSGFLRAERSGLGNGRVYTLNYRGADVAGNSAPCSATVTVPHDQRK